jgi:Putative beta-barrel porin-2, OmpL-like. bbp2
MKKNGFFAAALTVTLLDLSSMVAQAQTAPTPATPAPTPAPAPAAEAAPPASPVSAPAMSGTLAANAKPMKIDGGPLGDLYVTGVLSGIALWQNNVFPGDEDSRVDVSNAQVVVQKVDGPIQFFAEGGAYSFPSLGTAYLRAGKTTGDTFGGLPVWFLKYAPSDSISVLAGNLPTLIGAEYGFTFQNVNIQRGLIWNQENIINRGIQGNYTAGPLALSIAWSDGYFSNRYSWLTGSATYTIDTANTLAFTAGGSVNTETTSTFVTPELQNNSTIYNVVFTHTSGPWTFIPTLQYTNVATDSQLPITKSVSTFGGGLYGIYTMDGGYSLAGRFEYISSNGSKTDPLVDNLLYGPGSGAWSLTITPTYQNKFFFARAEVSYVKATSSTPGFVFGSNGTNTSQTRLMAESGFIF